jgi:hypothetical protein
MEGTSSYDSKRNWFLWGTALTWVLSIPFVVAVFNAFRGISEQKATGLGAVAGGLTEGYVTLAIVIAFVLPVGAIVLLVAHSLEQFGYVRYFLCSTSAGTRLCSPSLACSCGVSFTCGIWLVVPDKAVVVSSLKRKRYATFLVFTTRRTGADATATGLPNASLSVAGSVLTTTRFRAG